MSQSSTQVDWESRYRAGATGWERDAPNPAFLAWRDSGALGPCRILVPGAGRSHEPLALAAAGFDVTVLDIAPSAAAAQAARLAPFAARARVVTGDLFAHAPDLPYDAIYDQTCLCALPPERLADYVTLLAGWLRPGGRLFALFMQTGGPGGPPFDCPLPSMRALFVPPRWEWPAALDAPVPHGPGRFEQPAVLTRR
jgi:SAM-dependent methyltransferase